MSQASHGCVVLVPPRNRADFLEVANGFPFALLQVNVCCVYLDIQRSVIRTGVGRALPWALACQLFAKTGRLHDTSESQACARFS